MKDARQLPKHRRRIGRVATITFLRDGVIKAPARVDTGAATSAVWASGFSVKDGVLSYTLFDKPSPLYTGEVHETTKFKKVLVVSSIGERQRRYKVRLLVQVLGKKINAQFTLADRSKRTYPVLIGRNVLRGKFVVDVQGKKQLYQE